MVNLQTNRQHQILEEVNREGGIVISRIATRLGVSEMTVRRDLKRMADQGLLVRVHGGAVAAGARFDQRLASNTGAKAKATRKLRPFVRDTGTVYLDGSTTMLNLVGQLKRSVGLQIATNNAETFRRLAAEPHIDPILIGGRLDRRTDNLVGPLALRSIESLAFDAAFFSTWGLSAELGPMEVTVEDAEVKEQVARRSQAVYLAVDHNKFNVTAAGSWRPDPQKTTLVTDLAPADTRLEPFVKQFGNIV